MVISSARGNIFTNGKKGYVLYPLQFTTAKSLSTSSHQKRLKRMVSILSQFLAITGLPTCRPYFTRSANVLGPTGRQ